MSDQAETNYYHTLSSKFVIHLLPHTVQMQTQNFLLLFAAVNLWWCLLTS